MEKLMTFRGWVIATDGLYFYVFSKEEWAYGAGYRTPEFECGSVKECKENILSY